MNNICVCVRVYSVCALKNHTTEPTSFYRSTYI